MSKMIVVVVLFLLLSGVNVFGQKKMHKLTKEERAKLTPDLQIAYENDRSKARKGKREETVAQKVKRAKKSDRASRKIKQPSRKRKSS